LRTFSYERVDTVEQALEAARRHPQARFVAGGTNLLDLMKHEIEAPTHLVDLNRLGLDQVETTDDGGLRLGALVRNSDLASDARVRGDYPVLARALLAGASGQLRNRATTAGNLLQRTRCYYFYDPAKPCNKRTPGSGCSALGGFNRIHAIVGQSQACIATHPSDMAVAMRVLDAEVRTASQTGGRTIPIAEFHRLPGDRPERDTMLELGELITHVTLPAPPPGRQLYRKVRDRASYAFALISVAAIVEVGGGRVQSARIAWAASPTSHGDRKTPRRPWSTLAAPDAARKSPPTICWPGRRATAPTTSRLLWRATPSRL
jgi:xanthine dehydrogenase YagS FAD-binding subunit